MILGAKHVESPYIEFGQISTVIYFSYFLLLVPFISLLENSFGEINRSKLPKFMNLGDLNLHEIKVNNPLHSTILRISSDISKREFSTSAKRLTDTPGDEQNDLDDETSEEYKAVEERFEAERAKDEIVRCKEELADMANHSTPEKIEYTKGMITGDMKYEGTPITAESVDGIMNELMGDLEVAEQEAIDNINDANATLARLNNESNNRSNNR